MSSAGCLRRRRDADNFLLFRGRASFVILNLFPYTSGHLLVVANRHISSLSEASSEELHEIIDLGRLAKTRCGRNIIPQDSIWDLISAAPPAPVSNTICTCTFSRDGPGIRILFPLSVKPASFLKNCRPPIKDCFPISNNMPLHLRVLRLLRAARRSGQIRQINGFTRDAGANSLLAGTQGLVFPCSTPLRRRYFLSYYPIYFDDRIFHIVASVIYPLFSGVFRTEHHETRVVTGFF